MATLSELSQKYEKKSPGTMFKASIVKPDFPRIPTGIFAVDYMLGGGFPIGVTSSIYGPPGGGKTLVMTRLACGAQSICWNCFEYLWDCNCKNKKQFKVAIIQTEIFDMGWAVLLGLDPDQCYIIEPDSGEQASDIIVGCLRGDDCGLVLLDSLPMLVPIVELEASAMDMQVAAQAKLISKMIRRIKATLIKEKKTGHAVSFITTNQIRAKIGGFSSFGPQEEQPGGFTSKHDWHVTLRMSQLKSADIDKETELPINARFKASMVAMGNKRKIFTLSGAAEFYVTVSDAGEYLKGTVNDFKTVFRYADEAGLIERSPWGFKGIQYDKKQDIVDDWMNPEKFLSAKRYVISHYVGHTKTAMNESTEESEPAEPANA
jgi:RecA/RadA recombinase